jgi:aspartate carbamoyltransferase catalytic subunit
MLARNLKASVINAGDGQHEHPTQALLDLYTVREKLGSIEGKTITLVGDIQHSRVARSDLIAFTKMGAKVRFCGPPTLLSDDFAALGAEVHHDLKTALTGADVVYVLRLQFERHRMGLMPSVKAYTQRYAITSERVKWAKPGALVMHPGPMNRGVEITSDVADGPESVILDQVTNGVAVRMAVLYLVRGGKSIGSPVSPAAQEGTQA